MYYEIHKPSEGLFKDRGSKFLAFAFPVTDKAGIEQALMGLRKKYYDARHHCYAYRLGKEGETSFADDDGEPAHSAGTPILNYLRSQQLTNTLIVVVRYFGGTLLGVRGLIDAYKNAAAYAIENNVLIPIIPVFNFKVTFTYPQTSEVNRLLHPFQPTVLRANYTEICEQYLQVKAEQAESIKKAFEGSQINFEEMIEE